MSEKDLGEAVSETLMLENLETGNGEEGTDKGVRKVKHDKADDRLIVYHQPRSIESEYFRFLKYRIEQHFEDKKDEMGRVIMITGPNFAAGKTTCAVNLALAFARSYGGKTLLMDADSRRGTCRKYLGIQEDDLPGFAEVLTMRERAGKVLLNTGMFDMIYFPSGKFSEAFLDDLRGKELVHLMKNLKEKFKYIIVDAPPAFPMPETAIIAQQCDGVFIVLRAGRDGKDDFNQALDALEGASITGVILNGVKRPPGQRYSAYGYYGKRG